MTEHQFQVGDIVEFYVKVSDVESYRVEATVKSFCARDRDITVQEVERPTSLDGGWCVSLDEPTLRLLRRAETPKEEAKAAGEEWVPKPGDRIRCRLDADCAREFRGLCGTVINVYGEHAEVRYDTPLYDKDRWLPFIEYLEPEPSAPAVPVAAPPVQPTPQPTQPDARPGSRWRCDRCGTGTRIGASLCDGCHAKLDEECGAMAKPDPYAEHNEREIARCSSCTVHARQPAPNCTTADAELRRLAAHRRHLAQATASLNQPLKPERHPWDSEDADEIYSTF